MTKTRSSVARVPGARQRTFLSAKAAAESLLILILAFTVARSASVSDRQQDSLEVSALVDQAASPEVFYSEPQVRDSLIVRLSSSPDRFTPILLVMLDTPWALHFEVVKSALEKNPGPSRKALLGALSGRGKKKPSAVAALAAFEGLARPGDEKALIGVLKKGAPGERALAARCLAGFAAGPSALKALMPLTGHESAGVRLAALWAVGEVFERAPAPNLAGKLAGAASVCLEDPHLLVRLTAQETLKKLKGEGKNQR